MGAVTIVVDLGFGDSGKGTIVDYLVRTPRLAEGHAARARPQAGRRAEIGLVVRWNGGAQAGHAVVTDDGREHVFSQIGAGTFVAGVRTHLAEPFILHPTALLVEARHLEAKGVGDVLERLTIAESARVITPFHQATNRLRELARGPARHGTCGVGIGETVRDSLEAPDEIVRAHDLVGGRDLLDRRLTAARERLLASLGDVVAILRDDPRAIDELAVMSDASVNERWIEALEPLRERARHHRIVVRDEALGPMLREGASVLEGAQGMLLDERHGFHPHTTWSDCSADAASTLLAKHGISSDVTRIGVMRTYLTRHGEGPFPSESPELSLPEAHNGTAGWQGAFRVGHQDLVLMRYAVRATGGVDLLALTHADRLTEPSRLVTAYEGAGDETLFVHDAQNRAIDLRAGDGSVDVQCAHQERLGLALRHVRPVVEAVASSAFVERIETDLGVRVGIVSSGPAAAAKRERD